MCAHIGLQVCLTIAARVCRQRLAREPRRVAWYPGSTQKAAAFRSSLPGIEELGAAAPADAGAPPQAYLPWLFKAGLSPEEVCEPCQLYAADTGQERACDHDARPLCL